MTTVKKIVELLKGRIDHITQPRRLFSEIELCYLEDLHYPADQAAIRAEEIEEKVANAIRTEESQKEILGQIGHLTIVGASCNMVAGAYFSRPNDLPAVAKAKRHRGLVAHALLSRMQSLHFTEFELFGKRLLQQLGAQHATITPQSSDQGIDFYGILNLGILADAPHPFFPLLHRLELRFAGQAKHYPNRTVGTSVIRELAGSILLAKYQAFSSEVDLFDDLSLRAFNPLLAMVLTTGRFTEGAIELANRAGIFLASGEQLAVFLADCGVGVIDNEGSLDYSESQFHNWLHSGS